MLHDARARNAAAAGLLAFAGLFALGSLAHPWLPEDPASAAPLVGQEPWLAVHLALLGGFLAGIYGFAHLRRLVDQAGLFGFLRRVRARGATYAGLAGLLFLAAGMVVELALLPPEAQGALAGDAAAGAEFARLFDVASLLFHGGLFVFSLAALRMTRLLRRRAPWWFRFASTIGLLVAALASLAATPFPAPLTFFVGAPAVLLVAGWAGLLGLLLLLRAPAPRSAWDLLAG